MSQTTKQKNYMMVVRSPHNDGISYNQKVDTYTTGSHHVGPIQQYLPVDERIQQRNGSCGVKSHMVLHNDKAQICPATLKRQLK